MHSSEITNIDMRVERTLDATGFNRVANMVGVREWLGGEGELDLSAVISDTRNHAWFIEAGGGFLAIARGPGIYEIHSMFVPDARGLTVAAMRAGLAYMFCETDAFRLVTQVPDANKPAAALARKAGFCKWFRQEDNPIGPSVFMVLGIDEWLHGHREFAALGEWFHDQLEVAKKAAGLNHLPHRDGAAHDMAVGASVHMIRSGNPAKGVDVYNRWAVIAGYTPVNVLSFTPLVIEMAEEEINMVVQVNGDKMDILRCQ